VHVIYITLQKRRRADDEINNRLVSGLHDIRVLLNRCNVQCTLKTTIESTVCTEYICALYPYKSNSCTAIDWILMFNLL